MSDAGSQSPTTKKDSRRAVYGLILTVVLIDGLAATTIALANRPPLELGVGLLFGSAAGGLVVLAALAPKVLGWWRRSKRPGAGRLWNRPLKLMLLARLDWPLFIVSASWVGTPATAIIWGIKPIMTIVFLRRLVYDDAGQRRFRPLAKVGWLCLGLAAIGVVLVVASRANQSGDVRGPMILIGGLIGVVSAICAGLAAVRFEWGFRLLRPLPQAERQRLELPVIIGGVTIVGALVGLGLLLVLGLAGNWPAWTNVWPGLLIGFFLTAGGWSLATAAWLKTRHLGVGGLFYLTPPVTIVMLALAGQLGQINAWLFGIGGLLILASSLALVRTDAQSERSG